jgi:hypothetical protein
VDVDVLVASARRREEGGEVEGGVHGKASSGGEVREWREEKLVKR